MRSYRIDTLGDGLPGNAISVSSVNATSVSLIPATVAQTTQNVTGESISSTNSSTLLLGQGSVPRFGYLDFDISSLLPYRENLNALENASLDFDYSASSSNLPTNPSGDTPDHSVSVGGRYFTIMGDFSNKRLFATDGTTLGTTPIQLGSDGANTYFLRNFDSLKFLDNDLYFVASVNSFSIDAPGPSLWKLAPNSTVATLVAKNVDNVTELYKFGNEILVHRSRSELLRLDASVPSGISPLPATAGRQMDWIQVVYASTGAVANDTLLFTNFEFDGTTYANRLKALISGQRTLVNVADDVYAFESSKFVVVPASNNQPQRST